MRLSKRGATFLRTLEGFEREWYRDPVGVGTIGVGFTWRSTAFREWWEKNKPDQKFGPGATMTRAEAEDALLYLSEKEYGRALDRHMAGIDTPQHVFDGAHSAVFNLGPGSLGWKWGLALLKSAWAEAARLLKRHDKAGGRVLRGLTIRRFEEGELIEKGDYRIAGMMAPVEPLADGILERGERGEEVKELQRQLATEGHYRGEFDGIFGFGTEKAVLAFQRANGLTADGKAGPKTLKALSMATGPRRAPSGIPGTKDTGAWLKAIVGTILGLLASIFRKPKE